jgi:hypothetical protein
MYTNDNLAGFGVQLRKGFEPQQLFKEMRTKRTMGSHGVGNGLSSSRQCYWLCVILSLVPLTRAQNLFNETGKFTGNRPDSVLAAGEV